MINIRYASIRSMDISNGEGIGVALFVQGCHFHCKNCFNPETWDFNCGKEWTPEIKEKFLELIDRPYIKRISILGGEPLANENLDDILDLVNEIRLSYPQKSIWIYSGFTWEEIMNYQTPFDNVISTPNDEILYDYQMWKRQQIIKQCDVLVDDKYIDSLRDITLHWCGSSNQRVIDIKKSIQKHDIVLWQT